MLRRFQQICGIGCYSACRPARIQFENMSLIYGENCYGKSTLCDIIRSFADNEPTYITERRSVPAVNEGRQQVQLNLALPGEQQETTFTFSQGSWQSPLPDTLHLEVFDTEFIHRNLFTGLTIQRENHENITRFVFGDIGVRTAEIISSHNSELRAIKKQLLDWRRRLFNGIEDMESFLNMEVQDAPQVLEQRISEQRTVLESERRIAGDLEGTRSRPEPTLCPAPPTLNEVAVSVDEALLSSFEQVHGDAEIRLREHLENHTQNSEQARMWAQQGLTLIRGNICPFCEQELSTDAVNLIDAYRNVFNDVYQEYVETTVATLRNAQQTYSDTSVNHLRSHIEQNRQACLKYPELRSTNNRNVFEQFDIVSHELVQQLERWHDLHTQYKESLSEAIQHKKENIHMPVQRWDGHEAVDYLQSLSSTITDYNECLRPIIEAIAQFKSGLDVEQTAHRIQGAEQELNNLRLCKRRLELDEACQEYSQESNRKEELLRDIEQLQVNLDREQTEFTQQYFTEINRLFTLLGSRRFTISPERSQRGNMPTIQIQVLFNGEPIAYDRLRACFSESDRRALALAVFWARLGTRTVDERRRTIAVLDDPVTSFDDRRIDQTIRLIETYLPQLRQVIILSHYAPYIKTFFNRLNGQVDGILLAKLYQDVTGTQIDGANPLDFIENSHHRAYRRIFRFIQREHTEDISKDLRVFLETEVISRYYMIIDINNLRRLQFRALLDELVQLEAMTAETRDLIEQYRRTLNVDHHAWTERSHEEKIMLAEEILQLVYNGSVITFV